MSPVTADPAKNFQESVPFREDQLSLLRNLFALGDADPRWSIGPGAENSIRLQRSKNLIASTWGLPSESLFFIPDRYLAFYLAISGTFNAGQYRAIAHSPIEKKEVLAILSGIGNSAHTIEGRTIEGRTIEGKVSLAGEVSFDSLDGALLIHQLRNGETGIVRETIPDCAVVIDATSARPQDLNLGKNWRAVVLDAMSWDGPRGVNILAINPEFAWNHPLPSLDTRLPLYGCNYALTLLAATSLEQFSGIDQVPIDEANFLIRDIASQAGDVDIAGESTSDRLSLSFLYIQSEELQRELFMRGFLVDSGSACSSSELEPSHVLSRMGLLSQGNVRLRIRPQNLPEVESFAHQLLEIVRSLRMEV